MDVSVDTYRVHFKEYCCDKFSESKVITEHQQKYGRKRELKRTISEVIQ